MRCAHRVEARGLQEFDPSFFRTVERRGPKGSVVVMNASAHKLDGFTVEQQALVDRPCQRSHAKIGLYPVNHFAGLKNLGDGTIQRRSFRRPKLRIRQRNLLGGLFVTSRPKLHLRLILRDRLSGGGKDRRPHRHFG